MVVLASNDADISFALQSALGAAAAVGQHRIRLTGGGLVMPVRETSDLEETTNLRLRSGAFTASVRAEGNIEAIVRPSWIGMLCYGLLGAKAVSGAGDPYTHTLTPALTQPYFTFWGELAATLFGEYRDCKVTSATFSSDAAGILQCAFTVMGLDPRFQSAAEATVAVESTTAGAFLHSDGSAALKIEGTADRKVESWSIEINNNGQVRQGDSTIGYDVSTGGLEITVNVTTLIESASLFNRFHYGSATPSNDDAVTRSVLELAGSPAGIDFKFTRSTGPERSIQFLAPKLTVTEMGGYEASTDPTDILKQQLTLKGYDNAGSAALSIKVLNANATYAAA